jgi:hypothetical protein
MDRVRFTNSKPGRAWNRTPADVEHWLHRLVRCEVDFTHQRIRFYALRRRDPTGQPLLRELPYPRPNKPFQGTP